MDTTNSSLLERLRSTNDAEAWRKFVDLYAPALRSWAERCGIAGAAADDLVQDVVVIVWRKLPQFKNDRSGSFRNWLRTIASNKAREYRRRNKVADRGAGPEGLSAVADAAADAFWERDFRKVSAARALAIMKREFPEKTWRACWEMTFEGRGAADVGAELGMTPNACYIAKSRVLRRLRELLGDFCD